MTLARILPLACLLLASTPNARGQCQQAKLLVPDARQWDQWGQSVAFDGTTAVLGSIFDHANYQATGKLVGAAQVFELGPGGWLAGQKLIPSSVTFGPQFAFSMALDGEWLAISAPQDESNGVQQSGSIFMFRRQGGQWVEHQKLMAAAPTFQGSFGYSLALRGDRLVVGARYDSTFGLLAGAAHVFELQAGPTWVEVAKLFSGNPEIGGVFGQSVAVDGDTLLVGSPGEDQYPGLGNNVGATYVFERSSSGTWSQVQKLETSSPQEWQSSGRTVLLEGDAAFVGVPGYDNHYTICGAIFVFVKTPTGWVETQMIRFPDPQFGLSLGVRLAFSGGRLFAGTPGDGDQGINAGSVYVLEKQGEAWIPTAKVLAEDGKGGDSFSSWIAAFGDMILIGAPETDETCPSNPDNCSSGSGYAIDLGSDTMQICSCPAPNGPCGNHDDWGGCANSTGQGAVLSSCGSGSVLLDDLTLVGRWLPATQPAVLVMAGAIAPKPFGDGWLCIAPGPGGIHRFVVAQTTAAGTLALGPGLIAQSQSFPAAGHIQPGSTWHFQLWYRDAAGPCGSGINLTNALRATFGP